MIDDVSMNNSMEYFNVCSCCLFLSFFLFCFVYTGQPWSINYFIDGFGGEGVGGS